jgi:hypothetical protein
MTVITDKKAFDRKAIPILATDAKQLSKLLKSLSSYERAWLESAEFDASAGSTALIPDSKGAVAKVAIGVRDAGDRWALAGLPESCDRRSRRR